MNTKIIVFVGLALLVVLGACARGDGEDRKDDDKTVQKAEQTDATEPAGGLEIVRGHYVFGHEVRTLRPCDEDGTFWVIDRTNLLKGLHGELTPGTTPYAELFVVSVGRIGPPPDVGFGAEYPSSFTVEDVIYAAAEGFGCDFDWSRFLYRAQGNEPFWMLEVLSTGMKLTRSGHPDLTWTDVGERKDEGAVIFFSRGGAHLPVELFIEAGSSRDAMSGAYYGLSARMVLGDRSFTGHAMRGTAPEGD